MKEIPWFPCSQPDLAKTIKVEEDSAGKKYRPDGMLMTIIPKPRQIWSEGEDYVCQIKYDGVRCLIAWNDDYTATTSFSAESPRPPISDTGCINWEDKKLKEYLTSQIIPKEKDFMDDLLAGVVTGRVRSTTTPVESPLKYVSREDKTRNRVNLELITESILSNRMLRDYLKNEKLVLDGEIHSEVLELEETTGMWSSEKIKPGYESLGFRCFDCYWVDSPNLNYRQRMDKLLKTAPEMPRFSYVRTPFRVVATYGWQFDAQLTPVPSQVTAQLEAALQTAIDAGEEGLIIRDWTKPYNCGRSGNNLYKLKDFGDAEFTIIDVVEGMGKFTGVPIWVCDNGVGGTFKVTASGTQSEKEDKWRRRASFMGKPLRVKYERIAKSGTPLKPISLGLRTSL
tara:strand:+ start:2686 stop:3876 length:1191 start_codon:yes stop_codon:yes gene_type:complete